MFDRIKQYMYGAVAFVIAMLAALAYYYKQRTDKFKSKVGQLESEKTLAEVLSKKEEAENEAMSKENEYKRIRDAYNANSDSSGGDTET